MADYGFPYHASDYSSGPFMNSPALGKSNLVQLTCRRALKGTVPRQKFVLRIRGDLGVPFQLCVGSPSTQPARGLRRRHMGGCQNYGPLLGPLNTRCRSVLRTQKGTIILTTTHMAMECFLQRTGPQRISHPKVQAPSWYIHRPRSHKIATLCSASC